MGKQYLVLFNGFFFLWLWKYSHCPLYAKPILVYFLTHQNFLSITKSVFCWNSKLVNLFQYYALHCLVLTGMKKSVRHGGLFMISEATITSCASTPAPSLPPPPSSSFLSSCWFLHTYRVLTFLVYVHLRRGLWSVFDVGVSTEQLLLCSVLVHILSHINPILILTCHFCTILFNVIFPSAPGT